MHVIYQGNDWELVRELGNDEHDFIIEDYFGNQKQVNYTELSIPNEVDIWSYKNYEAYRNDQPHLTLAGSRTTVQLAWLYEGLSGNPFRDFALSELSAHVEDLENWYKD